MHTCVCVHYAHMCTVLACFTWFSPLTLLSLTAKKIQSLYDSLVVKDCQIYCHRARELHSSPDTGREELLVFSLERVQLWAMSDPSMLGRDRLVGHMQDMDDMRFDATYRGYIYKYGHSFRPWGNLLLAHVDTYIHCPCIHVSSDANGATVILVQLVYVKSVVLATEESSTQLSGDCLAVWPYHEMYTCRDTYMCMYPPIFSACAITNRSCIMQKRKV